MSIVVNVDIVLPKDEFLVVGVFYFGLGEKLRLHRLFF